MRQAKFLGLIHVRGGPITNEKIGDYSPGDILSVIPCKENSEFSWRDLGPEEHSTYFRSEELEFIPDKELDLNDYL